jgi:hypothetical protein
MSRTTVNVLRYAGSRDICTLTVLPFGIDHPERSITFVQGETKRSGIDISEEAYGYLVRDYRNELQIFTEDVLNTEMFRYKLEDILKEIHISKEEVIKIVGGIYNKKNKKKQR